MKTAEQILDNVDFWHGTLPFLNDEVYKYSDVIKAMEEYAAQFKTEKVYVLTNPEQGWDCVTGVYKNEKDIKDYLNQVSYPDSFVIHEETLE